jgi:hypothetical protein
MNKGLYGFPKAAGLGAAAWVNFSYVSGAVVINNSMNVQTVTRVSTGIYIITWAEPMPQNFYAVVGSCLGSDGDGYPVELVSGMNSRVAEVGIKVKGQSYVDASMCCVVAFA